MLIAHVAFRTDETDRAAALDVLLDEAVIVREMSDNLKFQAFANPEDKEVLEIIHEWETAEAFEAYLASENFAKVGAALGPKMIAPPVSKRFIAEPIAE